MFKEREFFVTLSPAKGKVLLGDGKISLPIQGIGTVQCRVGDHQLVIPNVRYIPTLGESIYSLFQHIKSPGHGLNSSFEGGLSIKFPTFETKAVLGVNDIYLDAVPCVDVTDFSSTIGFSSPVPQQESEIFCNHVTQLQKEIMAETDYLDSLIHRLRSYYQEVKTRCQLGFDVPAGFRESSKLQQEMRTFLPPRHSETLSLLNDVPTPRAENNNHLVSSPPTTTSVSEPIFVPIVRSVDKLSTSLPQKNFDVRRFLTCQCRISSDRCYYMRSHFRQLYQDTISFDTTPADAILDHGDFANMRKTDRNTIPVPRSAAFGDVIHMDIVFGPEVSIENVHYGLLFVDHFSRMSYVYPLQNLRQDIKKQLESFLLILALFPNALSVILT